MLVKFKEKLKTTQMQVLAVLIEVYFVVQVVFHQADLIHQGKAQLSLVNHLALHLYQYTSYK